MISWIYPLPRVKKVSNPKKYIISYLAAAAMFVAFAFYAPVGLSAGKEIPELEGIVGPASV